MGKSHSKIRWCRENKNSNYTVQRTTVIIIMDEDQKKCGGISAVGIAAILVSLACIVIGAINIDFGHSNLDQQDISSSTCKAEPMIPFYLLVAGLLNIIIIVLRLIFQRCWRKCGEPGEDNKLCNSLNFLCRLSCITIYDLLALAIVVIWLVIGSVWTFNIFDTVNLDNNGSPSYCQAFLYRFTYSTAILGWIFVAMALVFGVLAKFCTCFWNIICCKPCKEAEANQV